MKRILMISSLFMVVVTSAFAGVVRLTPCNSCPDDGVNIRQAIAVATQNGTVPGTVILTGNFTLLTRVAVAFPKVTLQAGRDGATLDGSFIRPRRATIELLTGADNFMVRGLKILGYRGVGFYALDVLPINNVVIENNMFYSPWRGVLQWASDPPATGWVVRSNQFFCDPDCSLYPVAMLINGAKGTIRDNVVSYAGFGLGILLQNPLNLSETASNWLVQGNTIDAADAIGIISGSSNNVIRNSASHPGLTGISISPGFTVDENGVPNGYGPLSLMNQVVNNEFTNKNWDAVFLSAGCSGNGVINNTLSISGSIGNDLELGNDDYNGYPIGYPVATNNQIHANRIAGGAIGILLWPKTADNVVTGNKFSDQNPPLQGIVDNGTGNIVRGNPGFDPMTGSGALVGPHALRTIKP
jgi:hypothetical protein